MYEKQISDAKISLSNLKSIKKANLDEFYKLGGLDKTQQVKFEKKIESFNVISEKILNSEKNLEFFDEFNLK